MSTHLRPFVIPTRESLHEGACRFFQAIGPVESDRE